MLSGHLRNGAASSEPGSPYPPYQTSKTGAPKYEDVGRLAKALVKRAPERMLRASN
jgi:hypothetical protein